jgi:catechol 2,3-dioxygenase-like lactoylglutathione lyase family enzyme
MITFNHTLVPAHDKHASARFYADMLGLAVSDRTATSPPGVFCVVRVGDMTLDFQNVETFEPHHYAFAVNDEDFDLILGRIKDRGLNYSADPRHERPGECNHWNGGRGLYFRDPNGHNLELLTRP